MPRGTSPMKTEHLQQHFWWLQSGHAPMLHAPHNLSWSTFLSACSEKQLPLRLTKYVYRCLYPILLQFSDLFQSILIVNRAACTNALERDSVRCWERELWSCEDVSSDGMLSSSAQFSSTSLAPWTKQFHRFKINPLPTLTRYTHQQMANANRCAYTGSKDGCRLHNNWSHNNITMYMFIRTCIRHDFGTCTANVVLGLRVDG